ncbi:MAG: FAD-binding domain-containing protein [Cyanobacteria bacterium P01_F01_bin.150]
MKCTIVWFRRDLRIFDHGPLHRAARRGLVVPVFILDRALLEHPEIGVARVAFMLECLRSLHKDLRNRGGRLIIRYGDPVDILPKLVRETQAEGIYAHVDFERIYGRVRDARLNRALADQGMKIRWFEPPGTTPDLVAYPNYRDLWYSQMQEPIIPAPIRVAVPDSIRSAWLEEGRSHLSANISDPIPTVEDLGFTADDKVIPPGGIHSARKMLQEFLTRKTKSYYWQLSYPGATATSGLSPHIKFGVISVRECYQTTQAFLSTLAPLNSPWADSTASQGRNQKVKRSCRQFISRLRWGSGFTQRFRYLPQLEVRSLYTIFDDDGWDFNDRLYEAWQIGQTGFPIIDAAARCLEATGGWKELNFRVRAIYSSFLSNLMGMDWRYGALHFMQHLIDGDCPIDHYQWAMQSGVTHCLDKTWTRIYNPGQAAVNRCDPNGVFIRRWLPELANVPIETLGAPPRLKDYPPPMLDYREARQHRVEQLESQRKNVLTVENVLPFLARLPESVEPFGTDTCMAQVNQRYPSDIQWYSTLSPELFPAALDLDNLVEEEAIALRTWFVAHVDIKLHRSRARSQAGVGRDRFRSVKVHDGVEQLNLW